MAKTTRKQEGSEKAKKPASCVIQLAALAECDIAVRLKLRRFQLLCPLKNGSKNAPHGI